MSRTAFTEKFGVALPIVGAPMDGVSYCELAAAVARAGGLGMIACAVSIPADEIANELQRARALVKDVDDQHSQIGIGLVNFALPPKRLEAAISCQPAAIWLSFPKTPDDWSEYFEPIKAAGIKLICQVQSVEQALEVARLGADAIAAQGYESGGHGASSATTLCFVPEVVDALRKEGYETPVLATGGIADGRQVLAALALGADGAVLGTLLACTNESRYAEHSKRAILAASDSREQGQRSQRTTFWDQVGRGPQGTKLPWPPGIDGRALATGVFKQHGHKTPVSDEDAAEVRKILEEGRAAKDPDRSCIWAGGGVGLIDSIESVGDVLSGIENAMVQAKERVVRMFAS